MYEIVDIEQRTESWKAFRSKHIGSSDSAIVMGINPWKSPYQLWLEKCNLDSPSNFVSPAMQRGIDLESEALECFCRHIGTKFKPIVIKSKKHPWMAASLDGISECGKYFVEIKVPGLETHLKAFKGEIQPYYYSQLQHIHECGTFEGGYYFSYRDDDGIYLRVDRDDDYIEKLIEKEKEFWNCVQTFTEPKQKYIERDDQEWKKCAADYRRIQASIEALNTEKERVRDILITLASEQSCRGAGLTLQKLTRKGQVDFASIPELKSIDLESYRKASSEYYKIDVD